MIHHPLLASVFVVLSAILALVLSGAKPRRCLSISLGTLALINVDQGDVVQSLLDLGTMIPLRDMVALYWNSRFLLEQVHREWLVMPQNDVTRELVRMEEEAHARTKRYLRLHLSERVGVARMKNASQIYSLLALNSFAEELSIVSQLGEFGRRPQLCDVTGAF